MRAPAIAFVAAAPLASWVVTAMAAHPALLPMVPFRVERAGALIFVALALWLASQELIGRHAIAPAYRAGLIFAAAAVLGSALGFEPLSGIAAALVFGMFALAGNGLYRMVRDGDYRPLLAAWLWSGLGTCALALGALFLRWPPGAYAFAHGRAVGIFENPNELALFALAFCAPAAGALLAGYPERRLALATLAAGILALFATGSRSGLAAFALGAVVLAIALRPKRTPAQFLALAFVALLGLVFTLGLDRRHNPAENDTRIAAWQAGLRTATLFPLTGVGIGAYYRVYPFVRSQDAPGPADPIAFDPHDFYLSVAAETGLVGLAAFLWTIVVFAGQARTALATTSESARKFSYAILAGLLAIGCHLFFNGFGSAILVWCILAAFALGVARAS